MIRTRDGWVGSANASSVLCRPPKNKLGKPFCHFTSLQPIFSLQEFLQTFNIYGFQSVDRFSIPLIDWWQFKTILIPGSMVQNDTTVHWHYNLPNVLILLPYHFYPIITLRCTTLIPVWYWFFANVLQLLYEFSATSFVRWYHFVAALDQLGYNVNTSPKPFPLSDILKHCPIWKEAHSRRLSSHQEKVLNWDQLELIKLNPVATKFFS